MKKWLSVIVCLSLLFSLVSGCTAKVEESKKPAATQRRSRPIPEPEITVTRVIDGDTIEISIDGRIEKIRLIGIDTPKQGRPFFEEATNKTKELVEGKQVQLLKDVSERDKYGRLLRYVFVGSTFVNGELVRQGYANAYTYPPDVKYSELFVKYEQEAREGNRGLWAQAAPSAPKTEQKPAVTAGQQVTAPKPTQTPAPSLPPAPSPAPAPQVQEQPAPPPAPVEATVHITNTGECYHSAGCSYLKSDIPISLSDAKARGYRPCSRCNPPL